MKMAESINVFGNILEPCCNNPKTGFFRNGLCDTCSEDFGFHTVCIMVTKEFLEFSKKMGNDLSTLNLVGVEAECHSTPIKPNKTPPQPNTCCE